MSKSTIVTLVALVLFAGPAFANPIGSIGELARHGQLGRTGAVEADCKAMARSSELRQRLRPSERRELIAECKRANQIIRIANNDSVPESRP